MLPPLFGGRAGDRGIGKLHTCVLASTGGQRTHPSFARKSFGLSPEIPQMGNALATPPCTWSSPPRLRYGRKKKGMASTEVVWSRGKGW